jgi:hypothetical protein
MNPRPFGSTGVLSRCPEGAPVHPVQGNALGNVVECPLRDRPNGPAVPRGIGPLGRQYVTLTRFPRALPWAGRRAGPSARGYQATLDYAENQAARQVPMRMADWAAKLDAFLEFNEYEVLTNAGVVSAEVAKRLAEEQYAVFRIRQDQTFESDSEQEIKRIEQSKGEEERG